MNHLSKLACTNLPTFTNHYSPPNAFGTNLGPTLLFRMLATTNEYSIPDKTCTKQCCCLCGQQSATDINPNVAPGVGCGKKRFWRNPTGTKVPQQRTLVEG
jgi:hypothetical protein